MPIYNHTNRTLTAEINLPHHLAFNWGKDWTLTFGLEEAGEKTELTLIHSGWDSEKVTEFNQPHTLTREFMAGGWGDLAALHKYIEGK